MATTFDNFADAVATADFRASLIRRRYRVKKDRINNVWGIYELIKMVISHG